jgi:hypothetical protein
MNGEILPKDDTGNPIIGTNRTKPFDLELQNKRKHPLLLLGM